MGKKNWDFDRVERKRVNKKQTFACTGVAVLSDRALNWGLSEGKWSWLDFLITCFSFTKNSLDQKREKIFSAEPSASAREEWKQNRCKRQRGLPFCWQFWNNSLNKFFREVQVRRYMVEFLACYICMQCTFFNVPCKGSFFVRWINSVLKTTWSKCCFDYLN